MKGAAAFLAAAALSALGLGAPVPMATVPAAQCVNIARVLSLGSEDREVKMLQTFLGVKNTGYFGHVTKQKLIQWQVSKGIIKSTKSEGAGVTGPKTRAAMKCVTTKAVAPATTAASAIQMLQPQSTMSTSSATATTTQVSSPATPVPQTSGSSGGPSSGSSTGGTPSENIYQCTPPGAKPAASTCTTGTWELFFDEAGCDTWYCVEPPDDRG